MVLTAVRGALGLLTRLPVGRSERAWRALGRQPAVLVLGGYVVGALVALPFPIGGTVDLPTVSVAFAYVVALLAVTGITHADGLADVGDALVVHGPPARRREVMGDTRLGVGGTVAVGVDLVGLALAGVALASIPPAAAVGIVVAAEVGAKLGMVALAVLGEAAHAGMGAHLTGGGPAQLAGAAVLVLPAALTEYSGVAPAVALVGAITATALVFAWATSRVGGVTGDVFGAANELARLAALHAGVIAWTLW